MHPDQRKKIYRDQADAYHRLILREDWQGNLPRALRSLADWSGKAVLDLNTKTGRLPLLLRKTARAVFGCDAAVPMLRVAQAAVSEAHFAAADHGALPFAAASVDCLTAGWSVCHAVKWQWARRAAVLAGIIGEARRVLRPGGTLVIIETLGTGLAEPQPPDDKLAEYYRMLEEEHGCRRTVVRTDYRFADGAEADELLGMFFGAERTAAMYAAGTAVARDGAVFVTEWTGLWLVPGNA